MTETIATATAYAESDRDERTLHARVQWFVEKWGAEDKAAELTADLALVVQAVHRDAMRETHVLLKNALAVMPPAQIMIKQD